MSFKDLEMLPLAEFIEKHRGTDKTMWFFQHIPKTAGSSFATELRKQKRPYRNICIDYSDASIPHETKIARSVDTFLEMSRGQTFRSASGHLKYDQIARVVEAYADCRVVTFLRQPDARVISDYRYQRTSMHPPHQDFIRAFPTLESYVRAPISHNRMAEFLLGDLKGITPDDAIERIGQHHLFLGLLEAYPMSFNIIFRLMGHNGLWPVEHQRRTPDTQMTRVEITEELRQLIRKTNRLDQTIYNYVSHVIARHRQAFRQLGAALPN